MARRPPDDGGGLLNVWGFRVEIEDVVRSTKAGYWSGRNLLAVMVVGTPQTLEIGVFAGLIGVSIGTILALVSAFYRGTADAIIRGVVDVGLTFETDDRAYDEGWQIDPVVCPDCLRWTLTAEGECCSGAA